MIIVVKFQMCCLEFYENKMLFKTFLFLTVASLFLVWEVLL